MKILLLTTSYPLSTASVSGSFVKRLVDNLPESCGATVLTPSSADTSIAPGECRTANIVAYRYAPKRLEVLAHRPGGIPAALQGNKLLYLMVPMLLVSALFHALKLGRRHDVLHANWAINGVIAGLASGILRRPLVTTLRGEDVARAKINKVESAILFLCLRMSDLVVTVSSEMSDWLQERFPKIQNKIRVIENGVDESLLRIVIPRVREDGLVRLVTIGSLIPRKGVDVILRALLLCADRAHLQLEVVGEGIEENSLKVLAGEIGVLGNVAFLGKVNSNEIGALLARSDILILASHSEGRPNVVLESMAAGVAVIASNIGGTRELISHDDNGLLFPDNDHKALASHIDLLSRDRARRDRLGRNARSFIVGNELLWSRTGERYCDAYHELVKRK